MLMDVLIERYNKILKLGNYKFSAKPIGQGEEVVDKASDTIKALFTLGEQLCREHEEAVIEEKYAPEGLEKDEACDQIYVTKCLARAVRELLWAEIYNNYPIFQIFIGY